MASSQKSTSRPAMGGPRDPSIKELVDHVQQVSLFSVSFIDAFCRRNLSLEEIKVVSTFVDLAMKYSPADEVERLYSLLRKTPQLVTRSAQSIGEENLDNIRVRIPGNR